MSLDALPQSNTTVFPKNNQVLNDSIIVFKWNHNNDDISFHFVLAEDNNFNTVLYDYPNILDDSLIIILTPNKTYFWKVRRFNGTSFSNWSTTIKFVIIEPHSLNNVNLLLIADSVEMQNDSIISMWYDQSGYDKHAYQSTGIYMPVIRDSAIFNFPAIYFDGTNDHLKIDSSALVGSLFIVTKWTGPQTFPSFNGLFTKQSVGYPDIIFVGEMGTTNLLYSFSPYFDDSIFVNKVKTNNLSPFKNYKIVCGLKTNPLVIDNFNISKDRNQNSRYWKGYIAEIIMFNECLNDSMRNIIENYLHHKYAPPVNLGYDIHIPYGFCDTTIDAGARFTDYKWSTDTITDTLQTITVNQSGTYSVTVTDIFGFTSTDTLMVYYPTPTQLYDTTICLGDTIYWNTNLSHDYSFLWSNGNTDSVIAIYEPGYYYISVTDSFGCSFISDSIHVSIDSFPQNATLGPDTALCAGNQITIYNGNASSFLWSTGDTTQYIQIDTAGQYWVTASNQRGCVVNDTINISIKGVAPTPLFTFNTTCLGDSTYFNDNSFPNDNSNIIKWQWDLGNSLLDTVQNPVTFYPDTGLYNIILTIETDSGCFNTITDSIKIHNNPVAGFTQTMLCAGSTVNFIDTSSTIDGNITTWSWDFGDGNTAFIQNPNNIFNQADNYSVQLIVGTSYGCKDTTVKNITIKPSPVSNFSVINTCLNKSVSFQNLCMSTVTNSIVEYVWDFDDSSVSNEANPVHHYQDTGYYDISLSVMSLNGCKDSITKTIYINPAPVAYFNESYTCLNTYYQLTDSSDIASGSISKWNWSIDSIYFYSSQNPVHLFNDTGFYSISLSVISDSLCSDTFSINNFYVQPLPDAEFSMSQLYSVPFQPVYFTNNSTGYVFDWDFGDGYTFTGENPMHSFPDSGIYTITLVASDTLGCTDTVNKQITVRIPSIDLAVTNVTTDINNNLMSISCAIMNYSNLPINEIDIYLHVDEGYIIKESWTGILNQGSYIIYNFNSSYQVNQADLPDLVCVNVDATDYTDVNPSNNRFCKASVEGFEVLDPYPNPANNEINFDVILPENGAVTLDIYDNTGKLIVKNSYSNLTKGYNKLTIDLLKFNQGTYTYKVNYSDISKQGQFIIKQ
ncbi:MAG: hypothetical protein Kow0068_05280 [Marinilabiliales bacterium]